MNAGQLLRQKRIHTQLTGSLVSAKSGVCRSRLSNIESGLIIPREEEVTRVNAAIDLLAEARKAMVCTAESVGWPVGMI